MIRSPLYFDGGNGTDLNTFLGLYRESIIKRTINRGDLAQYKYF